MRTAPLTLGVLAILALIHGFARAEVATDDGAGLAVDGHVDACRSVEEGVACGPRALEGIEERTHALHEIQVVQWDPDLPFIPYLTELDVPVVFRNTAVEKWPARHKWTPEYLREHVSTLKRVHEAPRKEFLYYKGSLPMAKEYEKVFGLQWERPYTTSDMDSATFFDRLDAIASGEETDSYIYFSGPTKDFEEIKRDAWPVENLLTRTVKGPKKFISQNWVGAPGVTAHTHYDTSHNAYAQLYGRKRFYLGPPTLFRNMYIFPVLHPSSRQSQVNFTSPDMEAFPDFDASKFFVVDLEPGDVLFFPRYWFHRVEALTVSISVNVWCDSEEYILSMRSGRLPLEDDWDTYTQALAVKTYLSLVLEGLGYDPSAVIGDMVRRRYLRIFEPEALKLVASEYPWYFCRGEAEPPGAVDYLATHYADQIAETLRNFGNIHHDAIRDLALRDWVEAVAYYALDVKSTGPFLYECFTEGTPEQSL